MSAELYRYPYAPTPGPNGSAARPGAEGWLELAVLDGWLYLAGEGDPPEMEGVTPELADLSPAIVAAGARHQFLLGQLAARRYAEETRGITWNGWPMSSDRDSRPNLIAAYQSAALGLRTDGAVWKFADGVSRSVSNAQMQALALAVLAHVQACFDREAELAAEIRASLAPDEASISTGWPATA